MAQTLCRNGACRVLAARVRCGALAVAAGLATKVPALFGVSLEGNAGEYMRNAGLYVLPFLTAYFAWKRGLSTTVIRWLALAFVAIAAAGFKKTIT